MPQQQTAAPAAEKPRTAAYPMRLTLQKPWLSLPAGTSWVLVSLGSPQYRNVTAETEGGPPAYGVYAVPAPAAIAAVEWFRLERPTESPTAG